MRLDVLPEPFLILAHAEEIIFFFDEIGDRSMIRAFPLDQFLFRKEPFTAAAVVTAIFSKINIAGIVNLLENILDHPFMRFFRRPDETVMGDV